MYDIEIEIEFAPDIMAQLESYAASIKMTVEQAAANLVIDGVKRETAKRRAEGGSKKSATDIIT